jgi:putative DNA methylase
MTTNPNDKLIDRWFPCGAVDHAVGTPTGSGRSEKAIFTWFASRPIAQARAAVLTALLPDSEETRRLVDAAVRYGSEAAINELSQAVAALYPTGRPVVLDFFSGRGIIPLEAARAGAVAVGIDLSPVATLASRLLASYPLQDWSSEPVIPFHGQTVAGDDDEADEQMEMVDSAAMEPRLVGDVRRVLAEVGRRVSVAVERFYPRNKDGSYPWGYLWAVTIPCDGCGRRFPLVGGLTLRNPYERTGDAGQAFRILTSGDQWEVDVHGGIPQQMPTFRAAAGKKGKSAHCPFCRHVHSLDAVKAKGFAGEYADALLAVADAGSETSKVFRTPRLAEVTAALSVDPAALAPLGGLSAVPDEPIPAGNVHTVRASGYGFRTYGHLMVARQAVQFSETARAIRAVHEDLIAAGVSQEYATALACYTAANMVRRIRRSTRGAKLLSHGKEDGSAQNRVQAHDIFADESKVSFQFDFLETGPGAGPGTWMSVAATGIESLLKVCRAPGGMPGRFRQGSAMALPLRDGTVDAVVTDPPYYNMIDYADASDIFYVWLKRALSDIVPDLFSSRGLQDKSEEIIVKNGGADDEHRTREFYEASLAQSFAEARRVLRPDGHLVVVFGHSDPDAWKRLLGALHRAGFVVTSSWPSRTESGNTGVASIKVTVTIGCRVAPATRPVATAAQVDREVSEVVGSRVRGWSADGLALSDQMMASYGPAMEVFGRYSQVLQPDGSPAPLERYLTLARTSAREAMHLKLDQIPLETFDAVTRFAVFWMRERGRTNVLKGEALFAAQSEGLRLDQVRDLVLTEVKGAFKLVLDDPGSLSGTSTPVFNVVRAMAAAWDREGSEGVAAALVNAERPADDQHVWAVVGDLVAQLPPSDSVSKALTSVQRNRTAIEDLTRGLSQRQSADDQSVLELSV